MTGYPHKTSFSSGVFSTLLLVFSVVGILKTVITYSLSVHLLQIFGKGSSCCVGSPGCLGLGTMNSFGLLGVRASHSALSPKESLGVLSFTMCGDNATLGSTKRSLQMLIPFLTLFVMMLDCGSQA